MARLCRKCSYTTLFLTVETVQTELLNMWDRPYHTVTTTTMLWNAASDDAGSTSYGRNDDDDTEYDTYGKSSSLGDNSGDTELADTDWGTHSYRYFSSQAAASLLSVSHLPLVVAVAAGASEIM